MAPRSVLVVQHVAVEGPALIAEALSDAGIAVAVARVHAGDRVPTALGAHAGLVVMGGPMGVYEQDVHAHLRDEIALIRSALAAGAPVLGVCLGSQLLAHALGARVAPGARKEIGWHEVELSAAARDDALFGAEAARFAPLSWHGDVFALPPGATPLARSALTEHQAFRHGASAWGLLFHLEADAAQVERMLEVFAGELRDAGIDPAPISRGVADRLPQAQALGRRVFARWAALVAARP